jgi:hypothetical protein
VLAQGGQGGDRFEGEAAVMISCRIPFYIDPRASRLFAVGAVLCGADQPLGKVCTVTCSASSACRIAAVRGGVASAAHSRPTPPQLYAEGGRQGNRVGRVEGRWMLQGSREAKEASVASPAPSFTPEKGVHCRHYAEAIGREDRAPIVSGQLTQYASQ